MDEPVDQQASCSPQSVQNGINSHVTDPEDSQKSGKTSGGGKSLAVRSMKHISNPDSEGESEDSQLHMGEDEVLETRPVDPPKPPPESEEDSDDRIHFHDISASLDHQDNSSRRSSGSNNANGREEISLSLSPVAPPESFKEDGVPPPPSSSLSEASEGEGGSRVAVTVSGSSETSGMEVGGSAGEIAAVTQVEGGVEESLRTGESSDGVNQTSFVNEYALNSNEISPMTEVDRKLEQFSEILLDSDASHSDDEIQSGQRTEEETTSPKMKGSKRVRFADEVTGSLVGGQ